MKRLGPFCVVLLPMAVAGQTLLPNGDFETYTLCPDYVSQIDRAVGWFRPTEGTSDYLNACLGVPFSESVPDNEFGYQAAHSGNGYAGFYCFYATTGSSVPGDNDREYVTHALSAPLIPGETYSAEFFVSLADVSHYAVDDIGALFSMQPPTRPDALAIEGLPQISNTTSNWLDDKTVWTRIAGCFVADSAYVYITIGNFHDGTNTAFLDVGTAYPLTFYSYYYVDDVSVANVQKPDLGPDPTTCDETVLNVTNAQPGSIYTWSTGAVGSSITVSAAGTYWVNVDVGGCQLSDTIEVFIGETIDLQLPPDMLVDLCEAGSVDIDVGPLPPGAQISWNTGALSPLLVVTDPGTYTVNVSAPGFCPARDAVTITDACAPPLYVPNAFTPDGDGINDVWLPIWLANVGASVDIAVFDRWGEEVYHTTSIESGWNGRINGVPAALGLYAYRIHSEDPRTRHLYTLSGHVTLLR